MKRLLTVLAGLAFLLLSVPGHAQAGHNVALTWTASSDAAANPSGNYNVYRAPSACTVVPLNLSKIGTALSTATTYTDSSLPSGTYCYAVTFMANGAESLDSNTTQAVILPSPPTGVTATVK